MPAERPLFSELHVSSETSTGTSVAVTPVREIKASELLRLSLDDRRSVFQGRFRIISDIEDLKFRKSWRVSNNVRQLMNGSVNPLAEIASIDGEWTELSYFTEFGDQEGPFPIPLGTVIEGHSFKPEGSYGFKPVLDRISPPPRAK